MTLLKVFLFIFFTSANVYANKLSLGTGMYSLNAEVNSTTTSTSNLGAYKFQYHSDFLNNFELLLSYNLIIEKTFTGDKAYGPAVGVSYYPFGTSTYKTTSFEDISIEMIKIFNPYVFFGFNQRQYQSIETSYSGFSIGSGVEAGWMNNLGFFAEIQLTSLQGPNDGAATETMVIGGITYFYR